MGDIDQLSSIISNVGFPIAAFLLMYRLATTTIKENTEVLRDLKAHVKALKNN